MWSSFTIKTPSLILLKAVLNYLSSWYHTTPFVVLTNIFLQNHDTHYWLALIDWVVFTDDRIYINLLSFKSMTINSELSSMNGLQISSIKPHLTFRINSIYFLHAWILCIVFAYSIYHLCILWDVLIQQPCYWCVCCHPRHDIAKILLELALNTNQPINQSNQATIHLPIKFVPFSYLSPFSMSFCSSWICLYATVENFGVT